MSILYFGTPGWVPGFFMLFDARTQRYTIFASPA